MFQFPELLLGVEETFSLEKQIIEIQSLGFNLNTLILNSQKYYSSKKKAAIGPSGSFETRLFCVTLFSLAV